MDNIEFQLLRYQDRFGQCLRFGRILGGYGSGKVAVGRVEFVECNRDEELPEKFGFEVTRNDLQGLVDMLWREGIRPSLASTIDTSLHEATKAHLDDLRSVLKIGGK